MELLTRLQDDMKTAMKSGDKSRLSVIRMLISDVKNIDLAPKPITAEETVAAYLKKLRKTQEEFQKLGKTAEVEQLKYEIGVVEGYLPKKASAEETAKLVDEFLGKNSFTEKQAGQATGAFMKAHGAQVEAGIASQLIRQKLAGK
ncbi:MAG TPA: GatB/YqeY domain-containing protein [Tepidisphaeraceae bacterium]|nr:GatB/YqeY domain-containing protein [Tepidisphaeraceae bacterium]